MKACICGTVLLISSFSFILPAHSGKQAGKPSHKSDTIFLKKRKTPGDNIVYVEQDRNSKFYQKMLDFKLDTYDSAQYAHIRLDLQKQGVKYHNKTSALQGLPRKWVAVHRYKQSYYLYFPADFGVANRKMITDSTICYSNMDGFNPEAIISLAKKGNSAWDFTVESAAGVRHHILIHIIDPKTMLAIWEIPGKNNSRFDLCVPAQNAQAFNMIVNDTNGDLPDEFEFDQIDFKQLLKHSR